MTAMGLGLYRKGTSHRHLPGTPRGFWGVGLSVPELGESRAKAGHPPSPGGPKPVPAGVMVGKSWLAACL